VVKGLALILSDDEKSTSSQRITGIEKYYQHSNLGKY
jgi:hypothetical protein